MKSYSNNRNNYQGHNWDSTSGMIQFEVSSEAFKRAVKAMIPKEKIFKIKVVKI